MSQRRHKNKEKTEHSNLKRKIIFLMTKKNYNQEDRRESSWKNCQKKNKNSIKKILLAKMNSTQTLIAQFYSQ